MIKKRDSVTIIDVAEAAGVSVTTVSRVLNDKDDVAEATPQRYQTGDLNFSYGGADFTAKTAMEIWDEWYGPLFQYIHEHSDVIRALAYINADWDSQPM